MNREQLETKIKEIQRKSEAQITLLKKEFELSQQVRHVKCSAFPTFTLFNCDTREQIREVLTAFPANQDGSPNPLYAYENIPYAYAYHIGIDNHIREIFGRICYKSPALGSIWIKFNPDILDGFVSTIHRKVYDTEYHYFAGQSPSTIGRMKIPARSFGTKGVKYYRGDEKLSCETTAREIIDFILS